MTNSYRPVSLTSQVVRLLERIIQDNMLNLAETNNSISCDQHGLKKLHVLHNYLNVFNYDWTASMENRVETDVIYLDFSKKILTLSLTSI